jgi:hypothetical protein
MKKKLQEDMKAAMKSGNRIMLDVVRMILAEAQKEEIASGKEATKDDVIRIMKKGIKSREDAVKLYQQGNREELARKEAEEIKILQSYLPKQLDEAEVEKIVTDIIGELGIVSKKDIGRLMKEVMGRYGSRLDGKTVQAAAQKKLP